MVEQIIAAIRQVRKLHNSGFIGKCVLARGAISEVHNIGKQIWATLRKHPIADAVKFIPAPSGAHQIFIEMHPPRHRLSSTPTPIGVVLSQGSALRNRVIQRGYELEIETGPKPEQKQYSLIKKGRKLGHLRTELVGRVESVVGIVADNAFAEEVTRLFLGVKKEKLPSPKRRLLLVKAK